MLRSLTIPCLLACLLLAAAAVVSTEPGSPARRSASVFEVSVGSDQSGLVQLYFDTGNGFNEPDSSLQPIKAGETATLRFALPYGRITALRFDPLDGAGQVTLAGARILDASGNVAVAFAPRQFQPRNEIRSLDEKDGTLVVRTSVRATDPSLNVTLTRPIDIGRPSPAGQVALIFAILVAVVLAVAWARSAHAVRLDERWRTLCQWSGRSPSKAAALVALLATVLANYPVIFAGKSFISPGMGVALLYGQSPWLPGQPTAEAGDPHKADVAALLWHHVPLSMIEHKAVFQDGELPLWNRYDSAGLPLLGQGQSCFGDPLHLIPVLADGAAWAWDVKFLVAKWLFAFGIGLCTWRAFRHLPTSLMLSASSAFIGFFVYRINHPAVFSLCYSPWILYCWMRLAGVSSARGAILGLAALIGANWTEMNSGTAKEAYVLLVSMNFTGVCLLFLSRRTVWSKMGILLGACVAGLVFAMIAAPVWVTFYHALKASYTSYNAPSVFQIQPGMLIGLFDEAFYRPFQIELGVVNPSANFFILAGLLWALVRLRALLSDRLATALLLSSIPFFALVFGIVPPDLAARVPFLGNILHVDNTFSCALIVILAVLSGWGLRDAWGRLGTREGRGEALAVVALAVLLFCAYLGTAQAVVRSAYADFTWGRVIMLNPFIYGYALSLLAAIALLLAAGGTMLRRGAATPGALVCLVLAFGAFHWREGMKLGPAYSSYVVRPTDRMQAGAESPAVQWIQSRQDAPSRSLGFHNDLLPGWSIAYGLEGISGPDALINPYYRELVDAAGVKRVWDWRYIIEPPEVPKLKPLLDALNVRYYMGYHMGEQRPGPELTPVLSSDMDVFESRTPWPRAFFTDSAAVYSSAGQFWSWMNAGDGRPFVGVSRDDWPHIQPQPRVSGDLAKRHVIPAVNYKLTTNSTAFTVTADGPGFIVLTEAYEADNFRAWLNGRRVPYLRVNHAFKGIYVDAAGTYDVRYSYWPKGFSENLEYSAIGIGLLMAAIAYALFGLKAPKEA